MHIDEPEKSSKNREVHVKQRSKVDQLHERYDFDMVKEPTLAIWFQPNLPKCDEITETFTSEQ